MRASNNYGPYQYPEKLIPLCILNALAGDPLPVYGDGMQVRNWLFVEDCSPPSTRSSSRASPANVYNVGGPDELANIEVVRRILALTDRDESLIEYVTDRPGHDRRYSLSAARLEALGWRRPSASTRESSEPCTGTARTRTGGPRSAPATTGPTTSASTARR